MDDFDAQITEFYTGDIEIGSIVTIRSRFFETIVSGEVVGVRRSGGMRVGHPTDNYDYIVYSLLAIKVAGIRGWINCDKSEGYEGAWEVLSVTTDLAQKRYIKQTRKEN